MATQFGSLAADFLIPTVNGDTYNGLAGADTYILTNLIPAGALITISDTEGTNKIQLVDGLTVKSSSFTANAVQFTLSNDAVITVLGATTFTWDLGMNIVGGDTTGTAAQSYAQLATAFGVATLPTGNTPVAGTPNTVVGVPPVPPTPTFTLAGPATVNEGGTATYTVTLSAAQTAATSVTLTFTAAGATLGTDTGAVAAAGTGISLAGSVLTFAAGSTTATVTVPVVLDTNAETGETITATLSAASTGTALGATAAVTTALAEVPVTYTLEGPSSVFEGATATYTIKANRPVDADVAVKFTLTAADAAAAPSGTSKTNLADFAQGAFNTFDATLAKGSQSVTYTVSALADNITELEETYSVAATAAGAALAAVSTTLKDGGGVNAGQTFTLTTGVDTIPGMNGSAGTSGTNGDDTVVAVINGLNNSTLTALDDINPGAGVDTLKVSAITQFDAVPGGAKLTGFEAVSIAAADGVGKAAQFDMSTAFAGVTDLTAAGSGIFNIKAPTTAKVNVGTSSKDAVTINGGASLTITADASTSGGATTVSGVTGAISITDGSQGSGNVSVDGGTDVTVKNTLVSDGFVSGTVTIGAATAPTGVVVVEATHKAVKATGVGVGNITITGGSTVSVKQTADSSLAATDNGPVWQQGAVSVTGAGTTTSVTVTQAPTAASVASVAAVAGTTESASVKFGALKAADVLIIGGNGDAVLDAGELRITVGAADMTAAEVATAFAGLINGTVPTAGDTQGGGAASKLTYDGALTGWTSGAASADTVVFTSTTATTNVADLAQKLTGAGVAPAVTTTAGAAATKAVTGVLRVDNGTVTIADKAGGASITAVTLDGYNTATIGTGGGTLSKLQTVSLANSGGANGVATAPATVHAAGVSTLKLTVNNVKGTVSLDGAADNALTSLEITASGANSTFALTAAAVKALTIAGDKTLDITGSTLTALTSVAVTGSPNVTMTVDATKATYTGGGGADMVTTSAIAPTKAINLGTGNDMLTLFGGTTAVTGDITGGDGTDMLSMVAADAVTASGSAVFAGKVKSFETLLLTGATGAQSVDVAALGSYASVMSSASAGTLTLDKLPSGGTLTVTGSTAGVGYIVKVTDAATGTSDKLNLVLSSAAAIAAGTVTAADVESVAITSADTNTTAHVNTLTLTADKATGVTVGGNAGLTLTMTGSAKVTAIDGSGMTAPLTVTSVNTTAATTITGGTAADVLTAATGTTADVLIGGGADDTLTGNAGLSVLTGGAGNDVFVVNVPSLNVNSYTTVTDFGAGDLIRMTGAVSFASAKVTLAGTAVFQDFANAAINALGAGAAGWFQYGGDTYIVADIGGDGASFVNNEDFVVRLTGLVDLTNASFNNQFDTIALTS